MTVLFVAATIILFLAIDWITRRARARQTETSAVRVPLQPYPVRLPEGIFFSRSHTWLNLFPSGKVHLGIDDFLGRMLEKPEIIFLKEPGEQIRKGEPLLTLKENEHLLTIRSPIDGQVLSSNRDLPQHPEYLRDLLFSNGWAYVVKPRRLADIKHMLLGPETRTWMHDEFGRLRDFFATLGRTGAVAPAFLQDGGPPMAGVMRDMGDDVWQKFEHEFLSLNSTERVP